MLLFKRPEQKNMHYKLLHNPYIKVEAKKHPGFFITSKKSTNERRKNCPNFVEFLCAWYQTLRFSHPDHDDDEQKCWLYYRELFQHGKWFMLKIVNILSVFAKLKCARVQSVSYFFDALLLCFYLKPFSAAVCSKPFLLTTLEALPFSSLLSYAFSLASSFFC